MRHRGMVRGLRSVALAGALGLLACDSPGGGAGALVAGDASATTAPDSNPSTDTDSGTQAPLDAVADSAPFDTGDARDTMPTPTETAATDTGPGEVTTACTPACIPLGVATSGVSFVQFGADVLPPDLKGSSPAGARPTGVWELVEVHIYPYGTFTEGITVTLEDRGGTSGQAAFQDTLFMLGIDLDLTVTVDVAGSVGSNTAQSSLSLGGCDHFVGATLTGDFDHCADGFPSGTRAPSTLPYAYQGNALSLGVTITRDMLIAMLPPDQQATAEFAIVGDLVLIAKFVN